MRNCRENALLALSSRTALDATIRPIGELMPVLLARYQAGPYRFRCCHVEPTNCPDAEQTAFAQADRSAC
jgi:hypothetical protein